MALVQNMTSAPLHVELEGAVVPTNLAWEATLRLVAEQPMVSLWLPLWALRGRSFLRRRLAERITLDPSALPYRADVVELLREQKQRGRRIVLLATDPNIAASVASHLGLLDWPDGKGDHPPAGKVTIDLPASGGRRHRFDPGEIVAQPRPPAGATVRDYARALRPHQWAKNLLLAVPLILSRRTIEVGEIASVLLAFLAFSLAASFVYVTNDLLDLPADRKHARKRHRPFASGRVPIGHGLILAVGLLGTAVGLAAALSTPFLLLVLLYASTCLMYSFRLKRIAIVDVLSLAGLYSLRLFAGGVATEVTLSSWLLVFSMFLFLSLAFAKRYVELASARQGDSLPGRGYGASDLEMIRILGPTSGYLAVLVIGLYIEFLTAAPHYPLSEMLWGICPVLLYWITRVWFLAQRGELNEDPVLYAVRDRPSLVCGALCVLLFLLARH